MAVCGNCGVEILEATAARHLGLCKHCWRRKLELEIGGTAYGREYDRVFRNPRLHSAKYLDCWLWVELYFASTLSETRYSGTAEYLFIPVPRIAGVTTPHVYRLRMQERISDMEHCIRRIAPESADDEADMTVMLRTAAELRQLIDIWLTFYVERHKHWAV